MFAFLQSVLDLIAGTEEFSFQVALDKLVEALEVLFGKAQEKLD